MQEVDDGAGIYVFNTHFNFYDPKSRLYVERNFVHDVKRGPYVDWNPIGGIYLDEGAQAVVIKDNVLREVDNWLHFNTGGGPIAKRCPNARPSKATPTKMRLSKPLPAHADSVRLWRLQPPSPHRAFPRRSCSITCRWRVLRTSARPQFRARRCSPMVC
jgi:hypothetical protein